MRVLKIGLTEIQQLSVLKHSFFEWSEDPHTAIASFPEARFKLVLIGRVEYGKSFHWPGHVPPQGHLCPAFLPDLIHVSYNGQPEEMACASNCVVFPLFLNCSRSSTAMSYHLSIPGLQHGNCYIAATILVIIWGGGVRGGGGDSNTELTSEVLNSALSVLHISLNFHNSISYYYQSHTGEKTLRGATCVAEGMNRVGKMWSLDSNRNQRHSHPGHYTLCHLGLFIDQI